MTRSKKGNHLRKGNGGRTDGKGETQVDSRRAPVQSRSLSLAGSPSTERKNPPSAECMNLSDDSRLTKLADNQSMRSSFEDRESEGPGSTALASPLYIDHEEKSEGNETECKEEKLTYTSPPFGKKAGVKRKHGSPLWSAGGKNKSKMSTNRSAKRSKQVNGAFKEAYFEKAGELDALREAEVPDPETNCKVKVGHVLYPILNFLIERRFALEEDAMFSCHGTGLWFSNWMHEGVLPLTGMDCNDPRALPLWISREPLGSSDLFYWLGPKFYGCTIHENCLMYLWDQEFHHMDRGCSLFDKYGVSEVASTMDVGLYIVEQRGNPEERAYARTLLSFDHLLEVKRWVEAEIVYKDHDMFSCLIEPMPRSHLKVWIDGFAARTSFNRNVAFVAEAMWKLCTKTNRSLIWASGDEFCPLTLKRGMMYALQRDSAETHKLLVLGGDYTEDSWYNFSHSLPTRFTNFCGASWRSIRKNWVEKEMSRKICEWVDDFQSRLFREWDDGDDPDIGAIGGQVDVPVVTLEGEPILVSYANLTNDSMDRWQRDLTRFARECRNTVGRIVPRLPGLGTLEVGPLWGINVAPHATIDGFEAMIEDSGVEKQDAVYNLAMSPWVSPSHTFIVDGEEYIDEKQFVEHARRKLTRETNPTLTAKRKWNVAVYKDLEKVQEDKTKLYQLWLFDWPLYKPARTDAMSAMTAILRLADRSPHSPKLHYKWECEGEPHTTTEVFTCDAIDDARLFGQKSLIPVDQGVWACPSAQENATRNMKPTSRNRRLEQLQEMNEFHASKECQKVFRKTDEVLFAAKPRLIFDCLGEQFWALRNFLQALQKDLGGRDDMLWKRGQHTVWFRYGGSMDPDQKSTWKRRASTRATTEQEFSAILVGGDDIIVVKYVNGVETENIELDVSKCDKSQTEFSCQIVAASFLLHVFGCEFQELMSMYQNMTTKTIYFQSMAELHTGTPETTIFNSITIGWAVFIGLFFDFPLESFMNACGYTVKLSTMPPGMGTFHKGFWTRRDYWVPLPSRICKFGLCSTTEQISEEALANHIAGVARGWRSMYLDPLFGLFINKACEYNPEAEIKFDDSLQWRRELWLDHEWKLKRPNLALDEVACFYMYHYGIDTDSVMSAISYFELNLDIEAAKISHPVLSRIYIRDYRCDTQADFVRYMSSLENTPM